MPSFKPSADLDMHYEVDDFTDPWTQPETVLMLHGNAESGLAWWRWVPKVARHYRVVRPDMRGFGQSSPMPREFPWTLDRLIEDFCLLMDHVRVDRFHLVGAKIGGTEFHQDPVVAADKKVVVSIAFTHPVDPERFEKRITLKMFERLTDTQEEDRGKQREQPDELIQASVAGRRGNQLEGFHQGAIQCAPYKTAHTVKNPRARLLSQKKGENLEKTN